MSAAITDSEFKTKVLESKGLVLVDFWADWCPPCHAIAPIIEKVAEEAKDDVTVYKLDVEANQQTSIDQSVTALPTIKLFKDGKVVGEWLGLRQKNVFIDAIEEHK